MHPEYGYQTRFLTHSPLPATRWTREEDKTFEEALTIFTENSPDRWQSIGIYVGKSAWEVKEHYDILVHDVCEIDSGRVELPSYRDDESLNWDSGGGAMVSPPPPPPSGQICFGGKAKQDAERKKGTPWSEEEHKLFLIGLKTYGKGDWRSISRNVVISRTPTQVASHAQKYYLRQNSVKKERKRASIHDITSVDNNQTVAPSADDHWFSPPAPPTDQCGPPGSAYQDFGYSV